MDSGMMYLLIGGLAYLGLLVGFIFTLIRTAKKSEWVWFVLTLIFAPVAIVYWIVKFFE